MEWNTGCAIMIRGVHIDIGSRREFAALGISFADRIHENMLDLKTSMNDRCQVSRVIWHGISISFFLNDIPGYTNPTDA